MLLLFRKDVFDFGNLETSQFSPFLNISRYFDNQSKKTYSYKKV